MLQAGPPGTLALPREAVPRLVAPTAAAAALTEGGKVAESAEAPLLASGSQLPRSEEPSRCNRPSAPRRRMRAQAPPRSARAGARGTLGAGVFPPRAVAEPRLHADTRVAGEQPAAAAPPPACPLWSLPHRVTDTQVKKTRGQRRLLLTPHN